MTARPIAVLRPEPGNAATAARIAAAGGQAIRLPLFAVQALAWTAPDPAAHDALFLTSANAPRYAGPMLAGLSGLPTYAVGAATAAAARAAGLRVVRIGDRDAAALAQAAVKAGVTRALHLAGRDRAGVAWPSISRTIAVYASEPLPIAADKLTQVRGGIALVHSPRAGRRLAALVADRSATRVVAISPAAAAAVGPGWAAVRIAGVPTDAALIAAAGELSRTD